MTSSNGWSRPAAPGPISCRTPWSRSRARRRGFTLLRRYAEAFPVGYRERFTAQLSVADIDKVEEALAGTGIAMNLYRPLESAPTELKLKLYSAGAQLPLSDVLPMLEHMGFKVISETPYTVQPRGIGARGVDP